MGDTIYLGKTVPDTGKKGLDNINEVKGIAKAIVSDYRNHKISYRTAMSRLNLLTLVVTKDSDFKGHPRKLKKAKEIIDRYRERLMGLRGKKI